MYNPEIGPVASDTIGTEHEGSLFHHPHQDSELVTAGLARKFDPDATPPWVREQAGNASPSDEVVPSNQSTFQIGQAEPMPWSIIKALR